MYGKGAHSQNDRSHYRASVLRLGFLPRSSRFLPWLSITIHGMHGRVPYEVYALSVTICARIYLLDQQDLKENRYGVILTSPEMCLGNSGFAALLKDPRWSRNILFMVVDDIGKTNGRFWRILGIMMDFGHHEAGNFISDVLT